MTENQEIATMQDDAMQTFVGKNYAFYQKKWQNAAAKKSPMSWNWAAFFLGVIWIVYRKMYLYAGIVIGLLVLDVVVESYFPLPEAIGKAVNWATAALFGWMGNHWYKTHVDKKIKEISATSSPEQLIEELTRQGGVNLPAAWALGIFILLLLAVAVWAILSGG